MNDLNDHATPGTWSAALGLQVTGHNPIEFLQGYLTANLERLSQAPSLPMSLCNLKGRVIVSGWIVKHAEDQVELIVHNTLTQKLYDVLTPYARFSRCNLTVNESSPCLAHGDVLREVKLLDSSDGPDKSAQIDHYLIKHRFAWISEAVSEKFLPQVLELHKRDAVDFDKGCYLGQEIVARAQFRGSVKKELVEFSWTGEKPQIGSPNPDGQTVIAVTLTTDKGIGLAVT